MENPASIRGARGVIAATTAGVVLASGVLMHVLDGSEYPTVWRGMWWALQTVTTVGYGDVTPEQTAGRIVASVVMLEGIAFLAIVTAAITSTFINRAVAEDKHAAAQTQHLVEARFNELDQRLTEIRDLLANHKSDPSS